MYRPRISFGKFRGEFLDDIPTDYLQWVLLECSNLDSWLRTEVEAVLKSRLDDYQAKPAATGNLPAHWDCVIVRWYRELALLWHPDRGGSTAAMQAVNDAHERLRELLGIN